MYGCDTDSLHRIGELPDSKGRGEESHSTELSFTIALIFIHSYFLPLHKLTPQLITHLLKNLQKLSLPTESITWIHIHPSLFQILFPTNPIWYPPSSPPLVLCFPNTISTLPILGQCHSCTWISVPFPFCLIPTHPLRPSRTRRFFSAGSFLINTTHGFSKIFFMPTITTDIPLELYRAFGKEASYKINQYPINKHSKNIMEMDSIHNTNRNLT